MGNLYIGEENAIQAVARDQAIQILHVLDLVDWQLRNPDAFLGITKGKEAHDAIILHEYLTVSRCGDHHAFLLRAKDQYPLAFLAELQEDAVIDIDHEDTQRDQHHDRQRTVHDSTQPIDRRAETGFQQPKQQEHQERLADRSTTDPPQATQRGMANNPMICFEQQERNDTAHK